MQINELWRYVCFFSVIGSNTEKDEGSKSTTIDEASNTRKGKQLNTSESLVASKSQNSKKPKGKKFQHSKDLHKSSKELGPKQKGRKRKLDTKKRVKKKFRKNK